MKKILPQKFFNRPADKVAQDLLGKFLVRSVKPLRGHGASREVVAIITETEAYMGPEDKACHAYRGRTKRNEPMFGPAGHWYVYFCYGMHWMLNIVTGPKGYPAAVLIRGIIVSKSRHTASEPKPCNTHDRECCKVLHGKKLAGPGKLTKFLKIDKKFNGKIADKKTGFWIEDLGFQIQRSRIRKGPRVGVDYAGEWARKPYRYWIEDIDDR